MNKTDLDERDWAHIIHCIKVAQDSFRKDCSISLDNVASASDSKKASFQRLADEFKRMELACDSVLNKVE